jgi:hypothetical protein
MRKYKKLFFQVPEKIIERRQELKPGRQVVDQPAAEDAGVNLPVADEVEIFPLVPVPDLC